MQWQLCAFNKSNLDPKYNDTGACELCKWSISIASVWAVECMAGVLCHTPPDRMLTECVC